MGSLSGIALLDVPRPHDEETFGSWLRRLAAYHGTTRETLARAILDSRSLPLSRPGVPIDWDIDPPAALLAAK